MSNNYEDYGYEEETKRSSGLGKKLLIVLLVVLAIILIILMVKGCDNTESGKKGFDYEKVLLEAGKKYFENNRDEMPEFAGECKQVELDALVAKGLVDPSKFSKCNSATSYVRVCILENKTKQYTPWLVCTDKESDSEYKPLTEGTLSDVVADSTYVEFKFLPQVINTTGNLGKVETLWKDEITYSSYKTVSSTKYYRYRDETFKWDVKAKKYYTSTGDVTDNSKVKEYYVSSPKSGYDLKDSKTEEAYKWYVASGEKVYAVNDKGVKEYSPNPITKTVNGKKVTYNNYDSGKIVTMYRTRTKESTYVPYKYYACKTSADGTKVVFQYNTPCGQGSNKSYTYTKEIVYSCADPSNSSALVLENRVANSGVKCTKYSEWSGATTKACTGDIDVCQSVTVTFYNWYYLNEEGGTRKYYPSNATTAAGESVYYKDAPVKGAIKDTSTKATAYKWYKEYSYTTDYLAVAPKNVISAKKASAGKWTEFTSWSTTNPKVSDGRNRVIETRTKIKLQQYLNSADAGWTDLSSEYISKEDMFTLFQSKNYDVKSLEDINNNGDIKYLVKMYVRNKKEASK